MRGIGVRELKAHASEILQQVREQKARYVITYRGEPIGLLTPIEKIPEAGLSAPPQSDQAVWDELDRLAEEIGRGWSSPQTSAELLAEMRR
jgi:prevent-host-death family protein